MPKPTEPKEPAPLAKEKPKAPEYGTPKERQVRPKLDPKFHHGGRSQTPDVDVNPAENIHIHEKDPTPTPDTAPVTRRVPKSKSDDWTKRE